MPASLFLAQVIGVFSIVMGTSMLVKRKMLLSIFHEISENRALSYVMGVLIFLLGLFVVLRHNVWNFGAPLIITLIGWGILIEGISYLFVSKQQLKKYLATLNNKRIYYAIATGYLILGIYFISVAF